MAGIIALPGHWIGSHPILSNYPAGNESKSGNGATGSQVRALNSVISEEAEQLWELSTAYTK